ncbi:hypothetical protein SASPL_101538 [Salvia splendens]|uniref:Uncharacterized protein n=1 Tax=Salvia splendens TaxID=180675 RepID=A0A8X8YUQ7_SALSN|nr:hypothetical protein SASPL_101538 [Salvia splendens]
MLLKPADCSHHAAFRSLFTSSSFRFRTSDIDGHSPLVFASKTLLKSRSFSKISRGDSIRRSCSLNLDDKPSFHVVASAKMSNSPSDDEGCRRKNWHCAILNNSVNNTSRQGGRDQDSFLEPRFDFLEPMMLGIRPEFPEWPDKETAAWAMVEQTANSLDIPLSLRMIKKKLQQEEGFASGSKEAEAGGSCSVKAAFASMVFIIVELQSCALHMREAMCDEDLDVITSKVQKELHFSFVWLFQQVFSRSPALMLHVMVLLANFSVHSTSHNTTIGGEASLLVESLQHRQGQQYQEEKTEGGLGSPSIYLTDESGSMAEMLLWDWMVDEAKKTREGVDVDHDTMKHFVSPVAVEIENDSHDDFLRADLLK